MGIIQSTNSDSQTLSNSIFIEDNDISIIQNDLNIKTKIKIRESFNHINLKLNLCIKQYEGVWWEIAKYPLQRSQKLDDTCLRSKTEYIWNPLTKSFNIINTFYTELPKTKKIICGLHSTWDISYHKKTKIVEIPGTGKSFYIKGKGIIPDKKYPRKLNVKFNIYPWNKYKTDDPNYFVLDTDYSGYSIVVSNNRKNLWILARSYSITKLQGRVLINKISDLGGDPQLLETHKSAII